MVRRSLVLLGVLGLVAVPCMAADEVIRAGIDPFITHVQRSFTDLDVNPIPAGFFCPGSKAVTGKIYFRGVPLATEPAGVLGAADTIIQRLDDAVFDEKGIAHTRIQMRALSMMSSKPIRTSCGSYNVFVSLAGEQKISPPHHMTIVRETENGGYFLSEFTVKFRLSFVPVSGNGPVRELVRSTIFRGGSDHKWANQPGQGGISFAGAVKVDTNGDGRADTVLPGTSNFAMGWRVTEGPNGSLDYAAADFDSQASDCSHG